jgi:hypothetical protein
LLLSLAETMMGFKPLLTRLTETGTSGGLDDASRQHIRSIAVHMARLVEDSSSGRDKAVQEVRSDIKLIARTIAARAEDTEYR